MIDTVIFGTGPVGLHTAKHFLAQREGETLRLVNRSGTLHDERTSLFSKDERARIELAKADATDLRQTAAAAKGAQYIFHCINPLYHQWSQILPKVQENLIHAAVENNAVLSVSENLYMYSRNSIPIDEKTPLNPPSKKGQIRLVLHNQLVSAGKNQGLTWVSIRASDFYGPGATDQSVFGTKYFLDPLYSGRKIMQMGNPDKLHSYTYVGDFGRALAYAAQNEAMHGKPWIVANNETTSTSQLSDRFMLISGKTTTRGRLSRAVIRFAGIVNPVIREIPEMLYQKENDYVVSGAMFEKHSGLQPTPIEEGIRQTIAWYENVRGINRKAKADFTE